MSTETTDLEKAQLLNVHLSKENGALFLANQEMNKSLGDEHRFWSDLLRIVGPVTISPPDNSSTLFKASCGKAEAKGRDAYEAVRNLSLELSGKD